MNGIVQGNPISLLLFNTMTADIVDITRDSSTSLIMYANNMVLGSTDKEDLQCTFDKLKKWARDNNLQINYQKTKQMIFRKGGKTSDKNRLTLLGMPLEIVPQFTYLGIILQTTLRSFNTHVQERVTTSIRATYSIRRLQQLSTQTVMSLFKTMIAAYGLILIWDKTVKDLALLHMYGVKKYPNHL